ncbi:hypothetical protein [Micromonospora sp. KC207]|uniref:hypothetical protein n=1 Tax=Micromonospora sp. KC207 TaxID=2530377 RepID=UPI001404FB88|nr:hypothetical protein [Micromonospora sp. KC207]
MREPLWYVAQGSHTHADRLGWYPGGGRPPGDCGRTPDAGTAESSVAATLTG